MIINDWKIGNVSIQDLVNFIESISDEPCQYDMLGGHWPSNCNACMAKEFLKDMVIKNEQPT